MSLDSDIKLLSRVSLFAGFQPDQLRLLAFGAEALTLGTGTVLFRQDSLSKGGYVIIRGKIDLISGPQDKTVSSQGPGSLIGEMALIADTENAASAVATEDTEVLKISRPLFRRMLEEYPELAVILQDRISVSVEEFMDRLMIVKAKLDHATDLATRPLKKSAQIN